jgi:Flp pilus assembly protein TadG
VLDGMTLLRNGGRPRSRGQALAEFALVFPVFMIILGGVIQFAIILWGQNSLNQTVRDIGRWAATQQVAPCNSNPSLAGQADLIARSSTLIGYAPNEWSGAYTAYADGTALSATGPSLNALEVAWTPAAGTTSTCPPPDNQSTWFVSVRGTHKVPIFFPFVPGNGTLSSTAQFRMEPKP